MELGVKKIMAPSSPREMTSEALRKVKANEERLNRKTPVNISNVQLRLTGDPVAMVLPLDTPEEEIALFRHKMGFDRLTTIRSEIKVKYLCATE